MAQEPEPQVEPNPQPDVERDAAKPQPARTVGEKLRDARRAKNLDLEDISARTRIPRRHLEAIEASEYNGLPSTTYAMGFAKAYARTVELDEAEIGRELRAELDIGYHRAAPEPAYEMEDPSRVPSSAVAWVGGLVAVLLLIGVVLWFGTALFRGGEEPPAQQAALQPSALPPPPPVTAPAPPPAATGGQVSLTATDEVWVRVYDSAGKTLYEKTMQTGDRYDVPADADQPMINIGRPDKIEVRLNGSVVAPLGPAAVAIKDVGVSADALRARSQGSGTSGGGAASAPVAGD